MLPATAVSEEIVKIERKEREGEREASSWSCLGGGDAFSMFSRQLATTGRGKRVLNTRSVRASRIVSLYWLIGQMKLHGK